MVQVLFVFSLREFSQELHKTQGLHEIQILFSFFGQQLVPGGVSAVQQVYAQPLKMQIFTNILNIHIFKNR